MPLRVAAISFLNPAPLLYDFEHEPSASHLRTRYDIHYTLPSRCASELHAGVADLGLIPIAELTPDLLVVPGCTIASLERVRSIVLLVRCSVGATVSEALQATRTIAGDKASRSSAAYVRVLLAKFYAATGTLVEHHADPIAMLEAHDAALLIGDPALLAREHREAIDAAIAREPGVHLLWLDVAELWRQHTGLPWVAAVWAVRPEAVPRVSARQLIDDLQGSRDHGLAQVEELVAEWADRLPLSPDTIRTYLTRNIYYYLDGPCIETIELFRQYAAELGILSALGPLRLLQA